MPRGVKVWQKPARDRAMLGYLQQGMTNPQIAAAMKLTHRSVRFYLVEVFQELGASNRTSAVMRAISVGWLVPPKPDKRDPDPRRQLALKAKVKR